MPEHCLFDHVHNQSVCQSSDYWNRTGSQSCEKRNMKLQSYAMLLPCGVGIFSGVEFVCCPASTSAQATSTTQKPIENLEVTKDSLFDQIRSNSVPKNSDTSDEEDNNADDDNDDDDYYDDDYEEDDSEQSPSSSTTTTTTTTTTERPIDQYLSHFDSMKEHDSFKSAQKNLEDGHREKVTKVSN